MSKEITKNELSSKKYFCSKFFNGLSVTPSGACAPCCLFERMISKPNGEFFKIWQDDLQEIYHSEDWKNLRQKTLNDEPIEECKQCYQVESHGGNSLRLISNEIEFDPKLNYDPSTHFDPQFVDLKLNNRCNLKCRMCQPRDSHLIYNEFKKIASDKPYFNFYSNTALKDPDLKIPLDEVPDWSSSQEFMSTFQEILPRLKGIALVGGEPLLIDEVYTLLELCVSSGYSSKIHVTITSNFMHVPVEKLASLLSKFRSIHFNISLDAMGKELNYIRFPSKFDVIHENFKKLHSAINVSYINFAFSPTVQVYNVLYLDQVYRYVDGLIKDGFHFYKPMNLMFLEFPKHLNIRILPKNIRDVAIQKLKVLFTDLPALMSYPEVKENLTQLIHILENEYVMDQDYIPEFLHYSDLLDKERNQRGPDYLPELYNLLANYLPQPPSEPYYQTRERGWALAKENKFEEAIKLFEFAILTSHNKELDYREMAWMKMSLGLHDESKKLYEKAYALKQDDPYILKGLAIQYKIAKDHKSLEKVLYAALKVFPKDEELLAIKNLLETKSL